ncbi:MAG: hypothetical protein J1F28_02310 [Oscillospiraceae bacterium]|nr:hypothetical protein [Oscillospiraceae bacterium]
MTVGSMARAQLNMASIMTKYGDTYSSYSSSYLNKLSSTKKTGGSLDALNDLLKSSALKNKSAEYKDMFSELYKNIYNISDDSSDSSSGMSSLQSIKTASADAGSAAMSIQNFANGLKYGGEIDLDSYKTAAQGFVDSYNAMIDKVGNSDSQSVLQQGVYMVNQAKVYSSALSRAGISLGSDNKLTLKDDLSKVSAADVKSTFGSMGFASKVEYRARNINQYSGGSGLFTANKVSSSSSSSSAEKVDNSGTIKELTAQIKERSGAIGDYIEKLNSGNVDFDEKEYNELAKNFIDSYNKMLSESSNSDKLGVNSQGVASASITKSYKFALQRAGFNVDNNGRISLGDTSNVTVKDMEYAFKNNSYLEKINQKAEQASSLANGASALGYNANKIVNYAYETGAIYNVYA